MRPVASTALAVALAISRAASAEESLCAPGYTDLQDRMNAYITERVVLNALRDTPLFAARSEQASAASGAEAGTTLANGSNFTSLIGAAFDQAIGGDDVDATTINLNPFLFAAMVDSGVYYDQRRYQRTEYELLRRVGGSITFGGKGDEVDQDGDGAVDEALSASEIDDIVAWEVRVRLIGSRDRRDPDNYEPAFAAMRGELGALVLPTALGQAIGVVPLGLRQADRGRENCVQWDALLEIEAFRSALDASVETSRALNVKLEEQLERADRKPLLTLAVTGVERAQKFGDDKIGVGLRGSWRDLTASFDWSRIDPAGMKALDEMKFGAEWARVVLKDLLGDDGVDASVAVALEILEDAPGVEHTKIFKAEAKLEIPIADGVSLPISLQWANHADFVRDADEVIGRVGITIDTAGLWDFAKGGRGGGDSE